MKTRIGILVSFAVLFYAGCNSNSFPVVGGSPADSATPAATVTVLPSPSIAYGFTVSGPAVTTSGTAVTFTVTALNQDGVTANTNYQGTLKFMSSDSTAALPASATAIGGKANFSVRFYLGGPQTLTVMDSENSNAMGTSIPTAVAGPQVSVGAAHACALSATGQALYCWGDNGSLESNVSDTSNNPYYVPQSVPFSSFAASTGHDALPTVLVGVTAQGDVSSGGNNFTCAVSSAKNVWCWGDDFYGQLGDAGAAVGGAGGSNNPNPASLTVEVPGVGNTGHLSNIVEVSASLDYACALSAAGNVYCWGLNTSGQLGNGTTNVSTAPPTPVEVVGGAQGGAYLSNVVQVAASSAAVCALTSGGNVYCWGSIGNCTVGACQLGDGQTSGHSYTPVEVLGVGSVGNLSSIVNISLSEHAACGTTNSGSTYCWGTNSGGELGVTPSTAAVVPAQVQNVLGSGGYLANVLGTFSSNAAETVCAMISGGTLDCWGLNAGQDMGLSTSVNQSTPQLPQEVTSGQKGGGTYLTGVDAVSVGASTVCAIATVSGNYKVYCWGSDGSADDLLGTNGNEVNNGGSVNDSGSAWEPMTVCSQTTTNNNSSTPCVSTLQL